MRYKKCLKKTETLFLLERKAAKICCMGSLYDRFQLWIELQAVYLEGNVKCLDKRFSTPPPPTVHLPLPFNPTRNSNIKSIEEV
jgi:hypothetical protein